MKYLFYLFVIFFFVACGGGGSPGESTSKEPLEIITSSPDTLVEDNFSKYQWYINDTGLIVDRFGTVSIGGSDLGLKNVYRNEDNSIKYIGYNNGNPIIVQVVDDGVDANHEDLKDNMHLSSSYNMATGLSDPTPVRPTEETHGTNVAGIIGAVGYNNVGIKGVAPSSNISGFKMKTFEDGSFDIDYDALEKAWLTGNNANDIAISNNSWGSCFDNDSENSEAILKMGAETLRDGKGRIYVFSAGNSRQGYGCPTLAMGTSNASHYNNSQYTIAVAAMNNANGFASYSSPGSNIMVSGYSGDDFKPNILTTTPTGVSEWYNTADEDKSKNYDFEFSGTSAAAPVVSGSLALVLEACPDLTYREVKELIANTSLMPTGSVVTTNAAGLPHSNDYGFGLINVEGMIDYCTSEYYTHLPVKQTILTTDNVVESVPATKTITVTENMSMEWIGLTVKSDYSLPGNLGIEITSPSGTTSTLLHTNNQFGGTGTIVQYESTFIEGQRFSSVAFYGEDSIGDWKINFITTNSNARGTVNEITLELVGNEGR